MHSIVYMNDSAECEVALRALAGTSARYGVCPNDVVAAVRAAPLPPLVVWDVEPAHRTAMIDAVARLRAMNTSLPYLFRVTLESKAIRALCGLLQVVGSDNVVISVRGHDSLARDVLALRETAYKKVEAAILARVALSLERDESGFLAAVVVAAVLLGRRPMSVRTLAEAVNVPPRRLRQRLHEVAGIDASTLLRWVFMLHCLGAAELLRNPSSASQVRLVISDRSH